MGVAASASPLERGHQRLRGCMPCDSTIHRLGRCLCRPPAGGQGLRWHTACNRVAFCTQPAASCARPACSSRSPASLHPWPARPPRQAAAAGEEPHEKGGRTKETYMR